MSGPVDSISPLAAPPLVESTKRALEPPRRPRAIIALVLALAAIVGALLVWTRAESSERSGATHHASTTGTMVARLDRIYDSTPAAMTEEPCPATLATTKSIPLIDFEVLEAFRHGRPSTTRDIDIGVMLDVSFRDSAARNPATLAEGSLRAIDEAGNVAVLRKVAFAPPHASLSAPEGGRYEGWLVVYDVHSSSVVCQTRIVAWSSRYVTEPGISEQAMKADLAERVRVGVREGATRIAPNLVLEL